MSNGYISVTTSMSGLTRAFTKRTKRPESTPAIPQHREGLAKHSSGTVKRGKISAPVQLISTTNMVAYNAPELRSASSSSSASSMRFRDDSDWSTSQCIDSPITSPDASSREGSPVEPPTLPSFSPKRSVTVARQPNAASQSPVIDTPSVPKRSLTHTKHSHQELARHRSLRKTPHPPLESVETRPLVRSPQNVVDDTPDTHPFGKELEQVREVAEEFGGGHVLDDERLFMKQNGLYKFSVYDYIAEVEELYNSIFDDDHVGHNAVTSWV